LLAKFANFIYNNNSNNNNNNSSHIINLLMGTEQPQSNGPINMVILHWPLMGGLLHLAQPRSVPNVTAHPTTAMSAYPSTANVPTSYYSM